MFPASYFGRRYFPARYWPSVVLVVVPDNEPAEIFLARQRAAIGMTVSRSTAFVGACAGATYVTNLSEVVFMPGSRGTAFRVPE
jgi:hypothetical protein